MKKYLLLTIIMILSAASLNHAQQLSTSTPPVDENTKGYSYPVDARPFIEKFNRANNIKEEDIIESSKNLRKTTAWNFTEGTPKNWWASDFTNNEFYEVNSTCRAVGEWCYVFVENSLWDERITQTEVNRIKEAFDSKTPADPNRGIYEINTETFGNPPNIDGDQRIILLILDIKDGYTGSGSYVAGYFYSYNQGTGTYSNNAEIYYLDGNPQRLNTEAGLIAGMSTTAHEFQHMIHFNFQPEQETFFNEAWSLVAEVVNGYAVYNQSLYASETNQLLTTWRSGDIVLNDYSRAARFSLYLYEQFGANLLKRFVQNKIKGINGVEYALGQVGSTRNFNAVLEDWFIANYLNDKSVDTRWGYDYPSLTKVTSQVKSNPNVPLTNSRVFKLGAQYLTFNMGNNLNLFFDNKNNSSVKVKAITKGTVGTSVLDVPLNSDYQVSGFGTDVEEATFIIYQNNFNVFTSTQFDFSYLATGSFENSVVELFYDEAEPTGVLNLSAKDTIAVIFDGIPGARLDSIKVALRQAGTVSGGIYEYTGVTRPTPLGKKLVFPLEVTSTISEKPAYPYPVPWPNWIKVDLTQNNIDAGNDFVVAFTVDGPYPEFNRVMITEKPGTNPYHSYTFLNVPSSGTPNWYYLTTENDGVYVYLIRAYLGFGTVDNDEVLEIIPSQFELSQNYPNPFNPSTTINYSIPEMSKVELRIYDLLGREIRTLISSEQSAGDYNIEWNGEDNFGAKVSSGIYFYTLKAGGINISKKMTLLK